MTGVAIRLTLLAACCGLLVSVAYSTTDAAIRKNRADHAARQLLSVVGRTDRTVIAMHDDLYQLRDPAGEVRGFIFAVTTDEGYNGRIDLWLATDLDGKVLGVRVKDHRETPGLGDKIDREVSDWILSFNGHSLAEPAQAWNVKRDGGEFDQFTGATITPRAVIHAVRDGLAKFGAQRDSWLAEARREP